MNSTRAGQDSGAGRLDVIEIVGLRLQCVIGVNPDERDRTQEIDVTLTLAADLTHACESDQLEDTVDYKALKDEIADFTMLSRFFLVEKLAAEIARICLRRQMIREVRVRIEKPGALPAARTVAIEICRSREDG